MTQGNRRKPDGLDLLLQPVTNLTKFSAYRPLDRLSRSIRLLHLKLESDGEIRAQVVHASLDKPVRYTALSYCWGPPDIPKKIFIGDEAVLIRSSLYGFLSVLCRRDDELPIWVDCICINQFDLEERNWQVSIMGDIYSRATRVESWLGLSDSHTEYAFAYMDYYLDEALRSSQRASQVEWLAREAFQVVLERPYWKRLWIIQEMALAQELKIVCGARKIAWIKFLKVCEYLQVVDSHVVSSLKRLRFVKDISSDPNFSSLRDKWANQIANRIIRTDPPCKTCGRPGCIGKPSTILDQEKFSHETLLGRMSTFSDQACQDPRDRIFGMLSIGKDNNQIVVDYTRPFAELLLDVLRAAQRTYISLLPVKSLVAQGVNPPAFQYPSRILRESEFCVYTQLVSGYMGKIISKAESSSILEAVLRVPSDTGLLHALHSLLFRPDIASTTFPETQSEYFNRMKTHFLGVEFPTGRITWEAPWDRPTVTIDVTDDILRSTTYSTDYFGDKFRSIDGLYHVLLEIGELQMCSQVHVIENVATMFGATPSWCVFSFHYSEFAIIALISFANSWQQPQEQYRYLRKRRSEFPRQDLCTCEVSSDIKAEAFATWKKQLLEYAGKREHHTNVSPSLPNSYQSAHLGSYPTTPIHYTRYQGDAYWSQPYSPAPTLQEWSTQTPSRPYVQNTWHGCDPQWSAARTMTFPTHTPMLPPGSRNPMNFETAKYPYHGTKGPRD